VGQRYLRRAALTGRGSKNMIVTILKWVLYIVVGGAAIDLFACFCPVKYVATKRKGEACVAHGRG